MTKKLGGWWRLWFSTSFIYGLAILFIAVGSLPKIENIPYDVSQLKLLHDSTMEIIAGKENRPAGLPEWAKPLLKELEMPNGAKITVPVNASEKQSQQVIEDYINVLKKIASEKKLSTIIMYFFVWFIPCLSALLIGFLFQWIYRGFITVKSNSNVSQRSKEKTSYQA